MLTLPCRRQLVRQRHQRQDALGSEGVNQTCALYRTQEGDGGRLPDLYQSDNTEPAFADTIRQLKTRLADVTPAAVEPVRAIVSRLRADAKKAVASEQFGTAIKNIGDEVAYLDQPEFAKFWDQDAKRVEAAVQSIGKVEG